MPLLPDPGVLPSAEWSGAPAALTLRLTAYAFGSIIDAVDNHISR
jgi:hypothetical protein